nr:unnamed protein product [Spirometra erinaceieuropaei]
MGEMPSSDTSSDSWSESDTDDSLSSTSMANECSSSSEGTSEPTDEEVGLTAVVEEEVPRPRESLRKWALRSKIPHSHLNDLLAALKPWLPDLPADARTLLGAKYFSAPSTAMVSAEEVKYYSVTSKRLGVCCPAAAEAPRRKFNLQTNRTMECTKSRSYAIYGSVFVALLAILGGIWLRRSFSADIPQVLSALQKLESSYRPLPQPHPGPLVIVGFGGCTDINVDAIGFFESLGVDPSLPTAIRPEFDGHIGLNSLDDVLAEFTEMFASGAAAERYVANKTLFNLLVEHATSLVTANTTVATGSGTNSGRPSAYFSLGGNAPVMAQRLAREGAEVTLVARLSPRERAALPNGLRVISAPSAFGLPDVPLSDVHLILEYERASRWRNFTAPRANRYILIRDEENPRLSGLWSGLLPTWRGSAKLGLLGKGTQSTPDLFVVSGLQTMDNSALNPDIRPERLDHLKWFLSTQLTPATLVHFEMASFIETAFVVNLTRSILPYVDSIGLNEQELPNLVSLLSVGRVVSHASVSTPRAAAMLDGMREVWSILTDPALPRVGPSRRRLSRIHLHTLGYQIIIVRRPVDLVQARKLEEAADANGEEINIAELGRAWPFTRAAAAKASLIAHRHTCATASIDPVLTRLLMDDSFAVTADPDRWASALLATTASGPDLLAASNSVPRLHFNASAPVSCWYEPEPAVAAGTSARPASSPTSSASRRVETRVEICVAPVPVCSKVTRTVGAGDNISAGALRAQLTTRAYRNRGHR